MSARPFTSSFAPLCLALLLSGGCAAKVQNLGAASATGAMNAITAGLSQPETAQAVGALVRAATISATEVLSDEERKAALLTVAQELVAGLSPQIRAAIHDDIGPELNAQIVSAVHASLIEATSHGNRARIETLAAGVTGAIIGQLGPDLAAVIRLDLGPAFAETLANDVRPAISVTAGDATDAVMGSMADALHGRLGDEIEHLLNRGEDTAVEWRNTFIVTAIVLGVLMLGSGIWLRQVYKNLARISAEKQHGEAALALVAGAIKNHEGSEAAQEIVASVRDMSKDKPSGEVIREMLERQPHLKVQPTVAPGGP